MSSHFSPVMSPIVRVAGLGVAALLASTSCQAAGWEALGFSMDAGVVYDDNVTRGKLESDRLPDTAHTLSIGNGAIFGLAPHYRLVVIGSIGGQNFQSYGKLSHVDLAVDTELQYRPSAEFLAPTLGLFAKVAYEDYGSLARDGTRGALGVSLRQPVTDRINAFAALTAHYRRAQSAVFSTDEASIRMNLDYTLSDHQTLYVGAEYREGDIVSTGRSSLENVTIAKVMVADDAFDGKSMFSYRMSGKTSLLHLGYNHAMGPQAAVDFSWRYVEATPTTRPSWASSPRSYVSNQVFASFLYRF